MPDGLKFVLISAGIFLAGLAIGWTPAAFRALPWWGDVLLVLVEALVVLVAIGGVLLIWMRRQGKYVYEVRFQLRGRIGWMPRNVWFHFDHGLPRLLRVWGIALGDHVFLRYGPPVEARKGRPVTQRWQAAHELAHVQRWLEEPDFLLGLRMLWQHVTIRRKESRSEEAFAYRHQHAIAMGTGAWVQPSTWFHEAFRDNWGDPDDPSTERRALGAATVATDRRAGVRAAAVMDPDRRPPRRQE